MYKKVFKRFFDFIISFIAIIILSPIFVALAIIVHIKLGSPVLFSQIRTGKDEKEFNIYKFRSMTNERDADGHLLPDEQRLTKFGSKIRSLSLDELPQLFNVLKGDLAIIGPRPLLREYHSYYTDEERDRFKVRAGLTQPEVLYGLVTPTWSEQFKCEVEYARNISIILDIKILFFTVWILFKRASTDYGNTFRASLNIEREAIHMHEKEITR